MARPANTDERRLQIVGGLISAMSERGYAGASIAQIARASGLAPGLIHYHFKNKQEILLAALEEIAGRHERRLQAALAGASSPPEKVKAFLDAHLGLGAGADPEALSCWVVMSGEALRQPEVGEKFTGVLERLVVGLEDIVLEGAESGAFQECEPGHVSTALVSLIQGYFVLSATSPALIPGGSALSSAQAMAEGLLGAKL